MLLLFSTRLDNISLMNLSRYLLQETQSQVQEAVALTGIFRAERSSWADCLRVAEMLLANGQITQAKRLLSKIDAAEYIKKSSNVGQVNLLFNVLIKADKLDESLSLLESIEIAEEFTSFDDIDVRIRIAGALLNHGQRRKAEDLLFATEVEKAYAQNTKLQNVFARMGWMLNIPNDRAYEKVIPYFEKDQHLGRLTGQWQMNYARALAGIGREDHAELLVEEAYEKNKTLRNGFAVCGWVRYFNTEYAPEKALQWFERDLRAGRLRLSDHLHNYAVILGSLDKLSFASTLIEKSYAIDAQAHSAYSSLGWYYYAIRKKDPGKALSFFEQDQKIGRFQPLYAGSCFAGLQACLGNRQHAEGLIAGFYEKDHQVHGFNLFVGFCDYARNQDMNYLRLMCKNDDRAGRLLRSEQAYLYAAVLFKSGEAEKATRILQDVANRNPLSQCRSRTWLIGNFPSGKQLADLFITPELKNVFNNFLPKTESNSFSTPLLFSKGKQ